ncbi:MAG: imidazolonepropionase [Melioribacteraceae bacterium]|nr:imidazolonepropionase [Melioribacteraceae bacterium]
MKKIIKNPAQIVTVNTKGKNYKRGKELKKINMLENHSIIINNETIEEIISNDNLSNYSGLETIDVSGKTVLPGLIDCHTHTAFSGSRADEFKMKLTGADYEDIAKAGGGINSTVSAVRKSSFDELVDVVKPRIDYFISQGITSLEIKSGYGLSFYDEIKLLQVIKHLNSLYKIDIIPTFLGAHTFPLEYKNDHQKYIEIISEELIPYIAKNKLAKFCDAFCEATAFTADQVDLIFTKAKEAGLKLKLHTEQFNVVGGLEIGLKHKVTSVDHLEVVNDEDIAKLAKSKIVTVLLPGVSFFLDYNYAPARKLIDNNAIVALSTDYNPGSSHIANISLIMSLAALKMKMSIEETISAFTINAAKALDIEKECGSIEAGKKADLAIFDTNNYSDIIYNIGKNLNVMTIKNGEIIYNKMG